MAVSPGSVEKLKARRPAQTDVEAALRDSNCADSCSSLDDNGRTCSSPSRRTTVSDTGSGSGVLDWQPDDDPSEGGNTGGYFSGCRCSGASLVALICLLLTLGSFVAPGSQHGVDVLAKHAIR